MKQETEDRMWQDWQRKAPEIYDQETYDCNPIVGAVNRSGHVLLEKPYGAEQHFSQVLEVGAGTGHHLDYVRHGYDRYVITDFSAGMLEKAKQAHSGKDNLDYAVEDATQLSFADNSFDRLISVYNLEHLPKPHAVLKEWQRVVKPDGVISIAIPTEGGVGWRFGRWLTTRRSFAKQDLNLDYIIAREHVNTAYNLISFIHYYFHDRKETWYPCRVPLLDINLIYACNVRNVKV